MKIGELARRAGSTSETVRYYERIGLLPRPDRTDSNYRDYSARDAERLAFIRHARSLGFELSDVRSLVDLAEDPARECRDIDAIASRHLAAVEAKIEGLERLREELSQMVSQCRGGRVASCRILEALGDHENCDAHHVSTAGKRSLANVK